MCNKSALDRVELDWGKIYNSFGNYKSVIEIHGEIQEQNYGLLNGSRSSKQNLLHQLFKENTLYSSRT